MESLETLQLMPIGRFARLTGITVKALRHYDELGLLRPARVEPATGYRFYGPEQVGRAEAILTLRRLEVPLDDVATLLASDDPAVVRRGLVGPPGPAASPSAGREGGLPGLPRLSDGK